MKSLVILMMEEEQPEGLSARKLVVETAKHNVLTAYNVNNGLDLLTRFPNVDMVLVHASLIQKRPTLLNEVRTVCPKKPVILATPFANDSRPEVDYIVDSHRPHELLRLLSSDQLQV